MNAIYVRELGLDRAGYQVTLCRTSWGRWSIDQPNAVTVFTSERAAVAFGTVKLAERSDPPVLCCAAYLASRDRALPIAEQIAQ